MTLVELKNIILGHFLSSAVFTIEDDLDSIKLDAKEDGEEFVAAKKDIVTYALNDLARAGILASVKDGLWVLVQPLTNINQTVVITPITALMLSDIVNTYTKMSGEQKETGYVVNRLNLRDEDIAALCRITHTVLSNDGEDILTDEDEEDDDGGIANGKGQV